MKKTLKLTQIRVDGGTQARAIMDQATITEYSEHMKEGAKFPCPVVFFDGTTYWMADGFHRYFANKANAALEIECDIHEGSQRDAQFYAMGANGCRGLKLRPEDVRKIIEIMLKDKEWGKMSSNAIAKHVGVSAMTVSRVRHSLAEQTEEPEGDTDEEPEDEPEVVEYTNKQGKPAKMKVNNLGRKPKDTKPAEEPTPFAMTNEEKLTAKLLELEDHLKETISENEKLRDAIAVGQFDGEEIEKIDLQDTLNELREYIRIKDIEIQALRESRDTYQNRAAELMKTVKALQSKLKKAGIE